MRSMHFAVGVVFFLCNAATALAVTSIAPKQAPAPLVKVTTSAAVRAEVDVQIRRLHHILVSNSEASEGTFDQLDRLEKKQRANH